jgi:hypothetical protein
VRVCVCVRGAWSEASREPHGSPVALCSVGFALFLFRVCSSSSFPFSWLHPALRILWMVLLAGFYPSYPSCTGTFFGVINMMELYSVPKTKRTVI